MKSHALGDLFNHHSFQVLVSLLILSSLLFSCNQPQAVQSPASNGPALKAETKVALPFLPVNFPHIDRHPEPVSWRRGAMSVVPTYDPNSSEMWQMDLRSYDLSSLDLRNSLDDLMYADYDSRTNRANTRSG
jgi:hypothetical protein